MKHEASGREIELDQVKIDSPCPMKWADLQGDERERYCGECSLHVVNLSAMTRPEGQAFLEESAGNGRVCVTYSRRRDGSLVTRDAASFVQPTRRLRRLAQVAASVLIGLFPLLAACRPMARLGGLECAPPGNVEGPDASPDTGDGDGCVELTGEVAFPETQLELPQELGDVEFLGRYAAPVEGGNGELPVEPDPSDAGAE